MANYSEVGGIVGNKVSENRIFWVFGLAVVASYLLAYHQQPYMAFYNDWMLVFALVIAVGLLASHDVHVNLPRIILLPILLAFVVALQAALGMLRFAWDAFLPIAYLLLVALAIVVGSTLAAPHGGANRLVGALVLGHLTAGLVSVVLVSMQLVGVESLPGSSWVMQLPHEPGRAIRPYANVGQPNQLALLFCFALACLWWLYQVARVRTSFALLGAVALIWGLVLTQSRIGWLILPLFAAFVWRWGKRPDFKAVVPIALIALLLTYAVLVMTLPWIAANFGAAVVTAADHVGVGTGSARWIMIRQAWRIGIENPWFGVGWYEFGPQQLGIGADFPPSAYSQHAHNIILNLMAEIGFLLTVVIVGYLSWWFCVTCLRRVSNKQTAFSTLFFVAALVHSLVEFPLWYAYVLLPLALLIGVVSCEKNSVRRFFVPRAALVVLFCFIAFGSVVVATDYRKLVLGFRALGWENLGLQADQGSTNKPDWTIFPQFYDYFRFSKTKARAGMDVQEIAFMEHVASRFGYASVLMRMSLIYALNDRPGDAVRVMKTIERLHPYRYAEAFAVWQSMALAQPENFKLAFEQMAQPSQRP